MKRLENRVAIITGAGRGIGFAAAEAFVREGAKVVLAEIDEGLGAQVEARLRAAGGEARFVQTDCGDRASLLVAEAVEDDGGDRQSQNEKHGQESHLLVHVSHRVGLEMAT